MSDEDGVDRRREPRHATRIEVDYRAETTFLFAYITDISSMGIFIQTDEPCAPGTALLLRFAPPPEVRDSIARVDPFELRGEVVWTAEVGGPQNPGMGVRFTELGEAHSRQLLELVNAIAYLDDAADE